MFKNLVKFNHKHAKLTKIDLYYLLAALVAFVGISLWTITKSSIWFDEAFGAYLIRFNFLEIVRYTAVDVHPPLYYWLLKVWSMLFGTTDLALRSMSVLFGVVAIGFGYILAHRAFGAKIARISLIFLVLSPMLVRYSQEMRMYTLVTAIAVVATYVLSIAVESNKRLHWTIYGVLIALGMWTHYFSALVWISHWIWRADVIRRTVKKTKIIRAFFSKDWIRAHVIAVALYSLWIPVILIQTTILQVGGFWIPKVSPDTYVNFYTNTIFYQMSNAGSGWSSETTGWYAVGFFALIVFVAWLAVKVYKSLNREQSQAYRLLMIVAFVPVVLLFLLSIPPFKPVFVDRYLIPSTFFTYLFIGVTIAFGYKFLRKRLFYLAVGLVSVAMMVGISNVWHYGNFAKTANPPASANAKQIYEAVVEKSGNDNQPFIADSPWLFYEAVSYSSDEHPVYYIDENTQYLYGSLDMLKYNDTHKIKDINKFTSDNPIVWYVGLPRGAEYNAPYSDWKELQRVYVDDSINGKPAYVAIQYQILSK